MSWIWQGRQLTTAEKDKTVTFTYDSEGMKLKGDKRGCAELKGKQYSLEEISKMLRESDIIEIDIKTATQIRA